MNSSVSTLKNMRILIIDDQEANLNILQTMLVDEGFNQIVGVCDPRRALEEFKKASPDLVILDWYMPIVGGSEVLAEIRSLQTADYVPIVISTADVTRHSRQLALNLGANGFVTKPFNADEVMERVNDLLCLRASGVRLFQPSRRLKPRHTSNEGLIGAWLE